MLQVCRLLEKKHGCLISNLQVGRGLGLPAAVRDGLDASGPTG